GGPAATRRGPGAWLERLDAEAGNLAAAVRWYLAHDPGPLPHLFRILWLFSPKVEVGEFYLLPRRGRSDSLRNPERSLHGRLRETDYRQVLRHCHGCQIPFVFR